MQLLTYLHCVTLRYIWLRMTSFVGKNLWFVLLISWSYLGQMDLLTKMSRCLFISTTLFTPSSTSSVILLISSASKFWEYPDNWKTLCRFLQEARDETILHVNRNNSYYCKHRVLCSNWSQWKQTGLLQN